MKLPRQLETLARMLAYILGHRPDEFGLVLDENGFVPLKQLQQALMQEPGWGFVRRHHLDQVVLLLRPPAFEIVADKIRCLQPGPLPRRRLGERPPPLLYLGLPPKAHERVWQEGLKAATGRELILARTREAALKLGKLRASSPLMITIQAQAATQTGVAFTGYGEELFLVQGVPREFLQMPAPLIREEKPKVPKSTPTPPTPGTFRVNLLPSAKPPQRRGKKIEPVWKAAARARRKKRGKGERGKGEKE